MSIAGFDPAFIFLLALVVLLVGLSKGGFGGGLGALAVPILSLLIDPRIAAALLLPILCAMDLFSVWAFRGKWHQQNLRIMLPAAMFGIVIGALSFSYMSVALIKVMIGVLALYFVLYYIWGKSRLSQLKKQSPSRVKGSIWSLIAGFVSYIAHAGGPPISIYLLPQRLHKTQFVATTVLFFTVVNYVKLIPYASLGVLNKDTLVLSLCMLPLAPVGVWLGLYLHHRVSEFWFYSVCYALLALSGFKLLVDGIIALTY